MKIDETIWSGFLLWILKSCNVDLILSVRRRVVAGHKKWFFGGGAYFCFFSFFFLALLPLIAYPSRRTSSRQTTWRSKKCHHKWSGGTGWRPSQDESSRAVVASFECPTSLNNESNMRVQSRRMPRKGKCNCCIDGSIQQTQHNPQSHQVTSYGDNHGRKSSKATVK